ncbi:hypothetical protein CLAFUW4_04636 [Fulvia fulva]|nr:hypothetical protein CLAFUR4_04622 [Fulvia fulva]WPV13702.1 hypothetical protein CLAFUW4_04636 [Fulvia fulva]
MTSLTIRSSFTTLAILALSATFTLAQIGTDTTSPAETDPADAGFNKIDTHNDDNDDTRDTVGLVNYYFVFLALVVCIAGVAAYLMYKRKQKYGAFLRNSRGSALERDVGSYDARARRRYWQGRWRSTDYSREEGLNEHGEAPPPYMPKTREEEANPHGLTVPMQTLSRDEAGLNKPPDYYSANPQPVEHGAQSAGAGASTPSQPAQSHLYR